MGRARIAMVAATVGALALGAGSVVPAAAAPVSAGVEREREGQCSASSSWNLSAEKEGKRIEVDVDVEAVRAGQRWQVRIWHNGTRITKVSRVTDGEGEFDVDRTVRNRKGQDRLTFKAVSSSGEVCRATIRI